MAEKWQNMFIWSFEIKLLIKLLVPLIYFLNDILFTFFFMCIPQYR